MGHRLLFYTQRRGKIEMERGAKLCFHFFINKILCGTAADIGTTL